MSRTWEEVDDEFDAVSEDGKVHRLVVYRRMSDVATTRYNPNRSIEVGKTVRTREGDACNRIDDDNFVIVISGIRVTRI